MSPLRRSFLALLGALALAGCATTGAGRSPAGVETRPEPEAAGAEVLAVVGGAESLARKGLDLDEARFSLEARDVALSELMAILSRASGRRLRAAPGIGATLSVHWDQVSVAEALERLGEELDLAVRHDGDGLVLDRAPRAAMLVRLPADPAARKGLLARMRSALSADARTAVLEEAGLLLAWDRPAALDAARRMIAAEASRDNRRRGGRAWTQQDDQTERERTERGRGSPST
jgi:hypothetical protein